MRSYPVTENPIGSAVQTNILGTDIFGPFKWRGSIKTFNYLEVRIKIHFVPKILLAVYMQLAATPPRGL